MSNKLVSFALFIILLTSCTTYDSGRSSMQNRTQSASISGRFMLPQMVLPSPNIQSLELHPQGDKTAPPIIKLGKSSLTLEFDYIGTASRQFRLSVSHRSKNWDESPIGPNTYLGSFYETTFGGGKKSFVRNPSYLHYSYTFPNDRIQITKSGNYLLSIHDYSSNQLLFRIPFFVHENTGTLDTRIESLFTERKDGRTVAQPFSKYQYPKFVQQPQFDLSFFYVQNQFWGRARQTDLFDTATPGEVHFHLGRGESFIADYEFNVLDLRSFKPDGQRIIDLQPAETPPIVTLRRDVQQFNKTISRYPGSILGIPRDDRDAEYGNTIFRLETDNVVSPKDEIYLVGDFNNWAIDERYRMQYDSTRRLWKGNALIKQGIYAYKYVKLENETINDLALDRSFTDAKQGYLTFVYFRDPKQQFDRLLQVNRLKNR